MAIKTNNKKIMNLFIVTAAFAAMFAGLIALNVYLSPALSANTQENLNANVVVSSTCEIGLNTGVINFGSLNGGQSTNTNSLVTDTNNGNANTYLWVYGGNWIAGVTNFGVSNTLWDRTSDSSFIGNALTLTPANTAEYIPTTASNNIYFGVQIPSAQAAATYNQLITILNTC